MAESNQERDLRLIKSVRSGDAQAKEELIKKYLPMVRYIAKNSCAVKHEHEDLVQEGLMGLLSAIDEYDSESHAVKFSSFAYLCIIRKIYNYVRQCMNNKNRALIDAVSLHQFVDSDETRTLMDILACDTVDPEEVVEAKWVNQRLSTILKAHLSILEYAVLSLLVSGYSTGEIEKVLGVPAKSVDNARTRVKLKLHRIVTRYGSLTSSSIPKRVRRRKDLYMQLNVTC